MTVFLLVSIAFIAMTHYDPNESLFSLRSGPGAPLFDRFSFTTYPEVLPIPKKPDGIKVVGLIFFGRRDRVKILNCYLERNLVENGGWLDEVVWFRNTDVEEDLEYLDQLVDEHPTYRTLKLPEGTKNAYNYAWAQLERGKFYIKLDDDVVWLADDTIPRIVTLKNNNPHYLVTSANMINSPLLGWVHYHAGALHPYLPEFDVYEPPVVDTRPKSWRYTDYPLWDGPSDYHFDIKQQPPFENHRWLRLRNYTDIHRTPIEFMDYDPWGISLNEWGIATVQHYSFLENLADNRLDRYKFGRTWVTDYSRLSINCICVYADDILDMPMTDDDSDEEYLTVTLPKKLKKSVAVDLHGIAVHFSFMFQTQVSQTDLFARYKNYAEEKVCGKR
ncbi:hypothetical protein DV738_g3177, partial [Chaetothyriales sp. CBS 135597]